MTQDALELEEIYSSETIQHAFRILISLLMIYSRFKIQL